MALKEQDIVFTTTDEAGNTVIQFPITRVENVEDAVRTVNKKKPDSNGDIQIDVDMSHLATKDELTKGLANKRDHTIQIANADLNTLLDDKTWACSGTLKNTPIACTFCIVQAYDTGAPISGNIVQVCYVPNQTDNTVRTFWRNCNNGVTFGKWSESGAVKTVNSVAPDASGEVTLPNATTSKFGLVRLAAEEDVLNEAPQTVVCTQLIYEINEFRRKSTAYNVGDKVDCAFQYERFLECTKAGTTSADLLDTRSVTHGQVITDGTAEWTVRTHVRSINGTPAKADGDVPVDVGVKTVNGTKPDSSGNVNVTLAAYPIGSIYMSTNSTDPGTLFGGTWQALNEGRVLIGASASHPAGETGGEETHTLTTREMPSHSHSGSTDSAGSHSHSGSATSSGDHKHSITYGSGEQYSTMPQYDYYGTSRSTMYTSSAGSHSHSVSIDSNGSHSHTVTINSTGGGQAHNNMQPYLSVYMWKRTA